MGDPVAMGCGCSRACRHRICNIFAATECQSKIEDCGVNEASYERKMRQVGGLSATRFPK